MSPVGAYKGWAIVEVVGDRRIGGRVSEAWLAGTRFLRLEVHHATNDVVTQFYNAQVVQCVTPTTEIVARALGHALEPAAHRFGLEASSSDEQIGEGDVHA